ncbi:MAG: hypothetical protein OEZ39_20270 [Gammaproteobacteria bacterium]|nr:hypothetical protein [Gammaproteobacteria bacterium]
MYLGENGQQPSEADLSYMDKFKKAVADFTAVYENLRANEAYMAKPTTDPRLRSEYDSMIDKGDYIQISINKANEALSTVKGWFGMDGLGFVPIVAGLVGAGLLAAVVKWTTDAYQLNAKIEEQKRLESRGMTPQQASNIVGKMGGAPLLSLGGGGLGMPLLIGGMLLFKFLRK